MSFLLREGYRTKILADAMSIIAKDKKIRENNQTQDDTPNSGISNEENLENDNEKSEDNNGI